MQSGTESNTYFLLEPSENIAPGSLEPGGCVATLELVPNEDRVSPVMPAAFSMTMLTSTAAGDAYIFRELSTMHSQACFSAVVAHPIPMSPHMIVMALA
jgi:hypothetical protein